MKSFLSFQFFPPSMNACQDLPKQKRVFVRLQLSAFFSYATLRSKIDNVISVTFWKQKEHSIDLFRTHCLQQKDLDSQYILCTHHSFQIIIMVEGNLIKRSFHVFSTLHIQKHMVFFSVMRETISCHYGYLGETNLLENKTKIISYISFNYLFQSLVTFIHIRSYTAVYDFILCFKMHLNRQILHVFYFVQHDALRYLYIEQSNLINSKCTTSQAFFLR